MRYSVLSSQNPSALRYNLCSLGFGGIANPTIGKWVGLLGTNSANPKGACVLGFRDVKLFNALLAKLSWRMIVKPNFLVTRVILGKYCHSSSFMECHITYNPSYRWRGKLAERYLMAKGLGWLVDDGNSIKLWSDPWLSTCSSVRVMKPPPNEASDTRVESILDPASNQWNWPVILCMTPHLEQTLKQLTTSSLKRSNRLAWLPIKSGVYTTKLDYAIGRLEVETKIICGFNRRTSLWKLATSAKVKIFLWKTAARALPVGALLQHWGIPTEEKCNRCEVQENILHVLFTCPFAKECWEITPFGQPETNWSLQIEAFLLRRLF